MNTAKLEQTIITRLETDTGTGGLYNIITPLVSAVYNGFALHSDVLDKPYVCMVVEDGQQDDNFTTDNVAIDVTFHIFDSRTRVSDACASTIERIYGDGPKTTGPTYGLHRWSMGLLSGSSTDTGAIMYRTGFSSNHDKDFWHYIERYTVRVERAGS